VGGVWPYGWVGILEGLLQLGAGSSSITTTGMPSKILQIVHSLCPILRPKCARGKIQVCAGNRSKSRCATKTVQTTVSVCQKSKVPRWLICAIKLLSNVSMLAAFPAAIRSDKDSNTGICFPCSFPGKHCLFSRLKQGECTEYHQWLFYCLPKSWNGMAIPNQRTHNSNIFLFWCEFCH
jgi:hypothetical protein